MLGMCVRADSAAQLCAEGHKIAWKSARTGGGSWMAMKRMTVARGFTTALAQAMCCERKLVQVRLGENES